MSVDYERIVGGRTYEGLATRLGQRQGDLYGDGSHFLFELLQNAEDALRGRDHPRGARFVLDRGSVRFSHCGRPFTEDDVRAVCDYFWSTKEEADIGSATRSRRAARGGSIPT